MAELNAFNDWDKTTGILIAESQITDLAHFTNDDETDPGFSASPAFGIASSEITNWNAAHGWGDHSTAGYLTSEADGDATNELQNLFPTFAAETGETTADALTNSLAIVGSGSVSTAISGDKLTIAVADSPWTAGTGDNDYRENSNVGVGTTDPAELLELNDGNLLISQEDPVAAGHIDIGGQARGIYVSGACANLAGTGTCE